MKASAAFCLCAASILLAGPTARAQDAIDGEFNVQRFSAPPGPRNFLSTRGARTDGEMAFSAGLVASYAYKPFLVTSCPVAGGCDENEATEIPVVESLFSADLMGSITPIPRVQVGLRVPVTWVKGHGITEAGTAVEEGISGVGIADPELEVKVRAYGEHDAPFVLGAAVFATAPLGQATAEGKYMGDSPLAVGGRVIADGAFGPFFFGVNLGGAYRGDARVGTTEIGPELRYGVALGYKVSPVLRVMVDSLGATRLSSEQGENALELLAGLSVTPLRSPLSIWLGGGGGPVEGVGVPTVRGLLGFAFVNERKDRDKDGLYDDADQCPTEPEDRDGYQDSDGCPEADNDLDAIDDAADKCPNEAEDRDGFQDADGCPDPDNDGDGVPDVSDRCPNEPETKNGFEDEDGCPDDKDTDGDGVPDQKDQCVDEPEDTDGFQDLDGCPDPDNDGDGIPDIEDECIDEPETINQFEDEDGCPDEPPGRRR